MIETREDPVPQAQANAPAAPATDKWGWYLYGITRRGVLATRRPERGNGGCGKEELAIDTGTDDGEPVTDGGPVRRLQMNSMCMALGGVLNRPVIHVSRGWLPPGRGWPCSAGSSPPVSRSPR